MAQNIQERDGRFQLRIKNKLLDRPYFSTFTDLKDKGLLSLGEYESRRSEILSSI